MSKYDFTNATDSALIFELFDYPHLRERVEESIITGQSDVITDVLVELDRRFGQHCYQVIKDELEDEAKHQQETTEYFRGPR